MIFCTPTKVSKKKSIRQRSKIRPVHFYDSDDEVLFYSAESNETLSFFQRLMQSIRVRLFEIDENLTEEERYRIQHSAWCCAVDSVSGRKFYYNVQTYETQWDKPLDLATGPQYSYMVERQRRDAEWFADMESNILASLAQGYIPGTCPGVSSDATHKDVHFNKSSKKGVQYILPLEKELSICRVASEETVMSSDSELLSSLGSDISPASGSISLSPLKRLISKMSSMDDMLLSDRDNDRIRSHANRRVTTHVY